MDIKGKFNNCVTEDYLKGKVVDIFASHDTFYALLNDVTIKFWGKNIDLNIHTLRNKEFKDQVIRIFPTKTGLYIIFKNGNVKVLSD